MGYPHFTGDCEDWGSHGSRVCRKFYGPGPNGVRPQIITLCGSTRFYEEFMDANYQLTCEGNIVLSVGFFVNSHEVHGEGVGTTDELKEQLDVLHKRKIDLSDRVLVLNVGGYIGDSTRSEIRYAEKRGIPIDYLEAV